MRVCVCGCVCVCACVCVHAYVFVGESTFVRLRRRVCVCMHAFMNMCERVRTTHVSSHTCMSGFTRMIHTHDMELNFKNTLQV